MLFAKFVLLFAIVAVILLSLYVRLRAAYRTRKSGWDAAAAEAGGRRLDQQHRD